MRCGCDRQSSHTRLSSAAVALRCIRAVKQISALLSPLWRRRPPARPLKTHARIRLFGCCVCVLCCGALLAPESIVVAPPQPRRGAARMQPPLAWRGWRDGSATCTFAVLSRRTHYRQRVSKHSLEIHSEFTAVCGNFRQFRLSEWERGKERKKDQVSVFALFAGS